jgi:hypothetical protein
MKKADFFLGETEDLMFCINTLAVYCKHYTKHAVWEKCRGFNGKSDCTYNSTESSVLIYEHNSIDCKLTLA